jgi:2-dehydropantoate 2-reductase
LRILLMGAGSTGGHFGGRLGQVGRDVTFLVRPGRAGQLRDKGLQIVSPYGDVTLTSSPPANIDQTFDAVC